jgi:hypothetical protein
VAPHVKTEEEKQILVLRAEMTRRDCALPDPNDTAAVEQRFEMACAALQV